MNRTHHLALLRVIPGAFLIVGIALWSWALRSYRLDGHPFDLFLVVALPASLVVGVLAGLKRMRELQAHRRGDSRPPSES
jgi:hypothetical protein